MARRYFNGALYNELAALCDFGRAHCMITASDRDDSDQHGTRTAVAGHGLVLGCLRLPTMLLECTLMLSLQFVPSTGQCSFALLKPRTFVELSLCHAMLAYLLGIE